MPNEDRANTALVFGVFNTLHLGHLRFLKFASEQADELVVCLLSTDITELATLTDSERMEALRIMPFIDRILLVRGDKNALIEELRPAVIVKGKEYENQVNDEQEICDRLGIRLVFGSGEPISSPVTDELPRASGIPLYLDERVFSYIRRHNLNALDYNSLLFGFSQLRVLVIGDVIVDEYVDCDAVGLSREDPTIVVNPQKKSVFLGGAGIVAAHAAGLGAKVTFSSVLGNDVSGDFTVNTCEKMNIDTIFFRDPSRPTTTKRRYRAGTKTLLRVNEFRQHDIEKPLRRKFFDKILRRLSETDMIVFSDFNYGFLCSELLEKIIDAAREKSIPMFGDSQSSSQVGDLGKFHHMELVTPTEHEARLTIQNNRDGLIAISESLGNTLDAKNIFITLGKDGVLIRKRVKARHWDTDELPALNPAPIDVAGAGDAMLITAALSLGAGASIWEAAFLGSVASACQVSRVGNIALERAKLEELLTRTLG